MAVEVSTPDFPTPPKKRSLSNTARTCAPLPVANVAASLAQSLYYEVLSGVTPPKNHKIVPEITVTLTYRFEATKEK
jgi:hypothetical protein